MKPTGLYNRKHLPIFIKEKFKFKQKTLPTFTTGNEELHKTGILNRAENFTCIFYENHTVMKKSISIKL